MSTNTQAERSFQSLPGIRDQGDDITKFRKAYIKYEHIFMDAAPDAMSKGYQLDFSGSFSRLSVGTDWNAIRTIVPEHASEEKLWRDRISRCRALIVWHAYMNDEGTLDQEKQERHYRRNQHDIERWETDYNEDVENKVRVRLLDSSDHIQAASAERDHIVLDREKLAQAVDSLSSELPDLVSEYGDFKAVCGLAIDEFSTTGLLNTLTLKEHVLGNETEMGNNDDGGSESDVEMGGMELRSGRVVRRG